MRRSLPALLCLSAQILIAQAPTLDSVMAKYYEARGGLARIQAVKSFRQTMTYGKDGATFRMTVEAKRPGKFRAEMDIRGT